MQLGSRNSALLGGEHWRAISDEDDDDDNDHALGLPRLGQGSALALAWHSSSSPGEVAPAPWSTAAFGQRSPGQPRLLEKGIQKHKGESEHFFWCQCHSWWELGHWRRAISAIISNYKKKSASKNKALCAWTILKADNSQPNRRGHLPQQACISAEVSLKCITNVGAACKGQ